MTVTLDLDPTLVAKAEAQAACEGTTLTHFVEQLVADRLAAAHNAPPPSPPRPWAEIFAELERLGPASQEFEDAIRETRAQDAELEARARARRDALWADPAGAGCWPPTSATSTRAAARRSWTACGRARRCAGASAPSSCSSSSGVLTSRPARGRNAPGLTYSRSC